MHPKLQKYNALVDEINQQFPKGSMDLVWEARYSRIDPQDMPWSNRHQSFALVDCYISDIASNHEKTVMELGCGDFPIYAIKAAQQGLKPWAVDISPTALDLAKKNMPDLVDKIVYKTADVLELDTGNQRFDLIVDDGCFHLFNRASDRARFAEKINDLLAINGIWISCLGSGEDVAAVCDGLITRSMVDIVSAIEPHLKIVKIDSAWKEFVEIGKKHFWIVVAQKRLVPAQQWHKFE
jgi:predicted RNA methylase